MAEIEVICAGLAMTTERLEGMLKDLKYKIYKETKEKDIDKWLKIHKNTESEDDYEEIMAMKGLLKGYTASIGHPSNGFAVELLELYPNAKVILTVDENSGRVDFKKLNNQYQISKSTQKKSHGTIKFLKKTDSMMQFTNQDFLAREGH